MRITLLALFFVIWVSSCATPPARPAPSPPPPVPAPVVQAPPVPAQTKPAEFQVSAERKQTSLTQIKVLVDQLNALIAAKDFTTWKTFLDGDYIRTYSDPAKLRDISARDPVLKNLSLKLKSLEDYFNFEVVPSRANTTVDDISFLDENRVYVWTVVDKERFLLYLLKLYGKEWKISSW